MADQEHGNGTAADHGTRSSKDESPSAGNETAQTAPSSKKATDHPQVLESCEEAPSNSAPGNSRQQQDSGCKSRAAAQEVKVDKTPPNLNTPATAEDVSVHGRAMSQHRENDTSSPKHARKLKRQALKTRQSRTRPATSSDDSSATGYSSDSSVPPEDKAPHMGAEKSSKVSGTTVQGENEGLQNLESLRQQLSELQRQMSDVLHSAVNGSLRYPAPNEYPRDHASCGHSVFGATNMDAGTHHSHYPLSCFNTSSRRGTPKTALSNCQINMTFQEPGRPDEEPFLEQREPHDNLVRNEMQASNGQISNQTTMHHRKAPKEPDFIRLDQVWSKTTSRHELHETPKACTDNAYEGYLFHVRRSIDSSGKHRSTVVDIQCELIQECLRQVMGKSEESGIEEENMVIDPDILFLYLEDIRSLRRKLKDIVPSGKSRKMLQAAQDLIDKKRRNLKVLVKYLEADYKQILNKLKPLLQNGLITFDLLWTLWRPNTLAFTDVYGEAGELQVFRVGKCQSRVRETRTTSFWIKGTYVDFDGKRLGRRNVYTDIDYFRGTRKINRLNVVPLQYHQNSENVRRDLIERGKKFVQLSGVLHKSYQGPAFWRAQASIIRREVHGRVMIDAGRHPQNNPLGVVAPTRSQGHDSDTSDGGDSSGEEDSADNPDSDGDATEHFPELELLDGNTLSVDMNSQKVAGQRTFVLSDEDYLLASPLVLGYSLQENTWAEFLVSGVKDISWNAQAYDFVVLEPEVKSVIKALADTQKRQATDCFDQDITGRGKGFIALLHGPSGTGKTLTVTAISEVLKCPLYTISTNEMGSSAAYLAAFLRQVFENCRSWGAILLISDADVYLENRTMRNTHRNSIVNVFLRQLSSFCGTMFLKTARVEEFDDELRSHVHVAVRYGKPDFKSKKAIFRAFLGLAPVGTQIAPREFTDTDLCELAKYDLNGRHIRNTVTTAQALAVAQGQALDMVHFRQVLEVAKEFERDIKGGPAFEDAMNSYC